MTIKEGLMIAAMMAAFVTAGINYMGYEHRKTTLRVYENNIYHFLDIISKQLRPEGRSFSFFRSLY